MKSAATVSSSGFWRTAALRAVGFLVFWLILYGPDLLGLTLGAVAVAAATWVSLQVLPPQAGRIRFGALIRWGVHFLRNSLAGGVDVAKRAFDPKMPLNPGFVVYPCRLPSGFRRSVFRTTASLIPGSLPADEDENGVIILHCLDVSQPFGEQMAAEESLVRRALGGEDMS